MLVDKMQKTSIFKGFLLQLDAVRMRASSASHADRARRMFLTPGGPAQNRKRNRADGDRTSFIQMRRQRRICRKRFARH